MITVYVHWLICYCQLAQVIFQLSFVGNDIVDYSHFLLIVSCTIVSQNNVCVVIFSWLLCCVLNNLMYEC